MWIFGLQHLLRRLALPCPLQFHDYHFLEL